MRAERNNHPAQAYITRKNANFHSSGGGGECVGTQKRDTVCSQRIGISTITIRN